MESLTARDRALATRLCMGVVATQGALDQAVDSHLRPGAKLQPQVRDALRLASFDLLYLATPVPVAVNEGVELVRSQQPRAAGLANAVLRRVAQEDLPRLDRARDRVEKGGSDAGDLALVGGLPRWVADELVSSRGAAFARELALSLAEPAPVYVAANRLRHSAQEAEGLLAGAGLGPRPAGVVGSFLLERPAGLASSGLVQETDVIPSDLHAQLVALLATPQADAEVLEVGQGRATKTLLMQAQAAARGIDLKVTGIDAEPFKARLAQDRLGRAGCGRTCRSLAYDGTMLVQEGLPPELVGPFDLVFLDAPCSGLGTLRRHPEIAWSLGPGSVDPGSPDSLPALQLRLMRAASSRVRPGGRLAYSTCSPLRQEDEGLVAAFLESPEGEGFSPVGLADEAVDLGLGEGLAQDLADGVLEDGSCCLPQGRGGADSHYLAILARA